MEPGNTSQKASFSILLIACSLVSEPDLNPAMACSTRADLVDLTTAACQLQAEPGIFQRTGRQAPLVHMPLVAFNQPGNCKGKGHLVGRSVLAMLDNSSEGVYSF